MRTKKLFKVLIMASLVVFVASCAQKQVEKPFAAHDLNPEVKQRVYVQKIDNFLIIFDASTSMGDRYKGRTKFDISKNIVSNMNKTIPDLKLQAGLRTFGPKHGTSKETNLIYGLTEYTTAGLENAIQSIIMPSGLSPVGDPLSVARQDLESTTGKIAVIVISDGKETQSIPPIQAAENLKSDYGARICIYGILVGDDPSGKNLLDEIVQAGECGFVTTSDNLNSPDGMADFVKKVFFEEKAMDSDGDGVIDLMDKCPKTPRGVQVNNKGCPLDSDGDGVYDYQDNCPDTQTGVPVDQKGCPRDSDGDGVYDYQDKCPGTPVGASVNHLGCWVIKDLMFETNKADIKPQFLKKLKEVLVVIRQNPGLKLEIQGHTDNVGAKEFNQKLSEQRAQATMNYFIKNGVRSNRLTVRGYGFARPAASNKTPSGRAINRRVELHPIR